MNTTSKKSLLSIATLLALVAGIFLAPSSAQANMRTLKAGKLVQISHPTTVKLPKSGCIRFNVKYKINALPMRDSYFTVSIVDDDQYLYSESTWLGGSSDGTRRASNKSGSLAMKVCLDDFYDEVNDTYLTGAMRGDYEIYVVAVGTYEDSASGSIRFS